MTSSNTSKNVELVVGWNADGPITMPLGHTMIAGGIGMGKSKLLESLLRQLDTLDIGFVFIDPHGDTAEDLLVWFAIEEVKNERKQIRLS